MRNHNLTPRWAQVSLACVLLLLGIGGGLFTMGLNAMFGMSRHWTMAVGFVLTDAAKITIPLAARQYGATRFLKCTFALCLAISVYAALNCWLTESGGILMQAGKAEESRDAARKLLAEAEQGLQVIAEQGSAEALAAQIETARTKHQGQASLAAAAGIDCARRTKCTEALAELAKAIERHGNATARDTLKRQRTEATAKLERTETTPLGAPDYIAAALGISRDTVAKADNIITALALIIAMECLVVLSFYGAAVLTDAARRPAEPRRPMVVTAVEPELDRQAAALAELLRLIAKRGHHDASLTELAEALNARRSTLHDWTKKWRDRGHICAEPGPNGRTRFSLPAVRAAN